MRNILTERDLSRIVRRVINEQYKRSPEHEKLYNEAIGLIKVLTFKELEEVMPTIRKKTIKKIYSRGSDGQSPAEYDNELPDE